MISENSEASVGSEDAETLRICVPNEAINLQTPKSTDDLEEKYKHKNLNAILPDPGNIIGLGDSQLGNTQG